MKLLGLRNLDLSGLIWGKLYTALVFKAKKKNACKKETRLANTRHYPVISEESIGKCPSPTVYMDYY